jgi:hypothetical protein
MKNKITREEKKQLWEEILKNNTTQDEQNEFSKPIQDLIFNTIVDAPIMPDIKPIDDNELKKS